MGKNDSLTNLRLKELGIALNDILSNIGEGVTLIDRDYVVVYQNDAHRKLKGDRAGELCYKAFRGRNSVCEDCHMQACFDDGETRVIDAVQECSAGERHLRITAKPVFNQEGVGVALTQVSVDVTDQIAAEKSAEDSREILKQIADNMDSMLYLAEADMSRVHYANPAYERIWGRPLQGIYEDPLDWMNGIHPEDLPAITANVENLEGPGAYTSSYRIIRPDGEVRHIVDKGFPIFDSGGRHIRYAGVAYDVTEIRDSEFRKSCFFSMLKHDLHGLLMLIQGNVEVLKSSMGMKGLAQEYSGSLDVISRNSRLIKRIIDDLALYSKMESGGHVLKLKRRHVGEMLTEVAAMHGGFAESRGVVIRKEIQAGLPEVLVDGELISRAVINLLVNAVNYSDGDEVRLIADKAGSNGSESVRISVADNGRGIPPEHHEKVFQMDYRVPAPNKAYGSGLGLAIVRQIAEAHSGMASISSEPGKGCTFTITLPVSRDAG